MVGYARAAAFRAYSHAHRSGRARWVGSHPARRTDSTTPIRETAVAQAHGAFEMGQDDPLGPERGWSRKWRGGLSLLREQRRGGRRIGSPGGSRRAGEATGPEAVASPADSGSVLARDARWELSGCCGRVVRSRACPHGPAHVGLLRQHFDTSPPMRPGCWKDLFSQAGFPARRISDDFLIGSEEGSPR